jgi:hypothetical protein
MLVEMRWTVALIAVGYWLLVALPLWWLRLAFGGFSLPLPGKDSDPLEILFLLSFYLPLLLLLILGASKVCGRRLKR